MKKQLQSMSVTKAAKKNISSYTGNNLRFFKIPRSLLRGSSFTFRQ